MYRQDAAYHTRCTNQSQHTALEPLNHPKRGLRQGSIAPTSGAATSEYHTGIAVNRSIAAARPSPPAAVGLDKSGGWGAAEMLTPICTMLGRHHPFVCSHIKGHQSAKEDDYVVGRGSPAKVRPGSTPMYDSQVVVNPSRTSVVGGLVSVHELGPTVQPWVFGDSWFKELTVMITSGHSVVLVA
ncbi:hypothetical protein K466DRAFT_653183 [Polyporus arcularius HHB13444]|uniref:Uncharacterized protein n=1 Tax=Polyporus arcularius HHB13444 TaxID=1314778 RepID=A0A5C3PCQ8_9APHY|nr:hypothetical protein K466DRAFT_653183 [Polyporus arcularius HHB13444]